MRSYYKSVIFSVFIILFSGCNVALTSSNREIYSKTVEYRHVAIESVKRAKSIIKDPITIDRMKTVYQNCSEQADEVITRMERMIDTNKLDNDINDVFCALTSDFSELASFTKNAAAQLNIRGVSSSGVAICEIDAREKSKIAMDDLIGIFRERGLSKVGRVKKAIENMDSQRWPDWEQM